MNSCPPSWLRCGGGASHARFFSERLLPARFCYFCGPWLTCARTSVTSARRCLLPRRFLLLPAKFVRSGHPLGANFLKTDHFQSRSNRTGAPLKQVEAKHSPQTHLSLNLSHLFHERRKPRGEAIRVGEIFLCRAACTERPRDGGSGACEWRNGTLDGRPVTHAPRRARGTLRILAVLRENSQSALA